MSSGHTGPGHGAAGRDADTGRREEVAVDAHLRAGLHGPGVGRRAASVSNGVDGADLEGVGPGRQVRIRPRGGARRERAGVDPATQWDAAV